MFLNQLRMASALPLRAHARQTATRKAFPLNPSVWAEQNPSPGNYSTNPPCIDRYTTSGHQS